MGPAGEFYGQQPGQCLSSRAVIRGTCRFLFDFVPARHGCLFVPEVSGITDAAAGHGDFVFIGFERLRLSDPFSGTAWDQ